MAIINRQSSSFALSVSESSDSYTLPTAVDASKSILLCSARGGSDVVHQANFRCYLSGDGTTVHVIRQAATSTLDVEFVVIQADEFSVQHIQESLTIDGTNPVTITSVDTTRAFPIYGGSTTTGSTRGEDDIHGIEITTSTNVNVEIDAHNSAIVNFQIVEMASGVLESVNLYKINQSTTPVNTTITSVDKDKTLLFGGGVFAGTGGGDMLQTAMMPTWELTTNTNLQSSVYSATTKLTSWVYVVEFAGLPVSHSRSTGTTSSTVSNTPSPSPTHAGALINGIFGRFSSANDTDDDSRDNMWSSTYAAGDWDFERTNTSTADLSYSTFDWDGLVAAGPSIDDVDGDDTVVSGQTGVAVTVSGFGGDITSFKLKDGAFLTPALTQAGAGDNYTITIPDPADFTVDTNGPSFGSIELEATDGTDTEQRAITLNPKTGWAVVTIASAVTGTGSVFELGDTIPDGSVFYYDTSNNTTVATNGIYTTDGTSIDGVYKENATNLWEPVLVTIGESVKEDQGITRNIVRSITRNIVR